MNPSMKRVVLIAVVAVVVVAAFYSVVKRDTGLPAASLSAAPTSVVVSNPTPPADPARQAQADRGQELQRRLAENPGDVEALTEVVDSLFQTKRYAQAADLLHLAMEAGAESPRLRMGLGIAFFYQGMPSLAQRELKRAIALDPSFIDAHFNYALTLSHGSTMDLEAARASWETVARLDPDGDLGRKAREFLAQPIPAPGWDSGSR